jgi:hypothetical protein
VLALGIVVLLVSLFGCLAAGAGVAYSESLSTERYRLYEERDRAAAYGGDTYSLDRQIEASYDQSEQAEIGGGVCGGIGCCVLPLAPLAIVGWIVGRRRRAQSRA